MFIAAMVIVLIIVNVQVERRVNRVERLRME
jgi:hypothetical protein